MTLFFAFLYMAFDLLCDISPASRGWKIRARIARMWDYTGTADDLPPMHVDLVLVDEKVYLISPNAGHLYIPCPI